MIVKLLTEHHPVFPSLKGGCRGSSESTLVKMSYCWKSHARAHFCSSLCMWLLLNHYVVNHFAIKTIKTIYTHVCSVDPVVVVN